MRIEIRNDSVVLDGYVNVVDRESKPIPSVKGKFIEKIKPGAFQRSLEKRANVDLLLNHDKNRKLGSTSEGNLELFEDNIGLRAICTVTDQDVIDKAKNKELRGWSFGFYAEKDKLESVENGYERRIVEELDLFEVSIVDNTKNPAYAGTSIEMRDDNEVFIENRTTEFKAVTVHEKKEESNTYYEKLKNRSEKIKKRSV
ncbi:HK97 family phage prohead protease [uncultured Clostridium sp.]|jgi:HK97 family phage prohead protease|uniref:HK97 family phage prohead protease n=1 Tax=uncultured Clostridium sp. TaxID=59620 RepID=UPI00205F01CF|nr:HK97 family phage prohead protease [uncultured Clostridium sp.]DAP98271.1 MAG TPA: head maturation protease [Caudoviricetes sp.]